ncbi:MAG: thiol-activated cytolysin family protein, partial [Gemmatimonadota bacterium]
MRAPVVIEEAYPGGDVIDYRCDVSGKNLVRTFPKLLAMGSDFSALYPGALIEGNSARSGRPVVIPIARAPLTIRINLPIAQQSKRVTDVNATTMLQAVADLQRAAAGEQGTRNVVPADMVFELSEANTFEQSMTSVGISLGYSSPLRSIAANTNIDGRTSRSVRTHSVVVKFVQEMFTVRAADDLLPEASDMFAP